MIKEIEYSTKMVISDVETKELYTVKEVKDKTLICYLLLKDNQQVEIPKNKEYKILWDSRPPVLDKEIQKKFDLMSNVIKDYRNSTSIKERVNDLEEGLTEEDIINRLKSIKESNENFDPFSPFYINLDALSSLWEDKEVWDYLMEKYKDRL